MKVKKRNGELEEYNVEKIHKIVNWALDNIVGVSLSDIELNAGLQLYDGITTEEIHNVLTQSAANLISEDSPNYQYVAARLLLYWLRKTVWGGIEPPRLFDHIKEMCNDGLYDKIILEKYSKSEINKIGSYIKHDRDYRFTYCGVQQLVDKYLVKNRTSGEIFETPQFLFMLVPLYLFMNYPNGKRAEYIKKAYDHLSLFKLSLPTPIMAGVRTKIKQFSSCILIDVDDDLDSIYASSHAIGRYIARRAGLGINFGRIRPIGSQIRNGEVQSTGVLPFLKLIESTVKSCSQGGIRQGSATVTFPFFHSEIEDILVLKDNGGSDENRIRNLDYSIQFCNLFYERVVKDEDITLLSPHENKSLYEKFGIDGFDEEYIKAEKNTRLKFRKKIKARKLMMDFCRERLETGRIYCLNMENANKFTSWAIPIKMSQLCQEVLTPVKPIYNIDDMDGEIGVCVLSSINLLETKEEELQDVCDVSVRLLDEAIDYQEFPVMAAQNFCRKRRSIGIGVTNLAAILAKKKISYEDKETLGVVNDIWERLQFYLLYASCELAKEKGKCDKFNETRYSEGLLPIDWYNKEVDKLYYKEPTMPWEELRKKIKEYGLRHSTLTSVQPTESSSVVHNATNGIEPVRKLLSVKKSRGGYLKQVVPLYSKYKNYYTKAFDLKSNKCLYDIAAVIQKWIDMGISLNSYYNYSHYKNEKIPLSVIMKDCIYANKIGLKTLYYAFSHDGNSDKTIEEEDFCNGACKI